MKKILFISNTANFSKFNRPFMRWFREQGWYVHYASMGEEFVLDCDMQFTLSLSRTPYNIKNIFAYFQLKKILINEQYDIVHCHTPIGGVIARFACMKFKKTKIIYTAHGFHFYKGAPILNWIVYYPMEKYLSRYSDAIITIVDEDYFIAKKKFTNCKNIHKIDGIGVDFTKFYVRSDIEKKSIREKLKFSETDFLITVVAEINKNKNQIMLVKAIPKLIKSIPHLRVLLIGKDNLPIVKKVAKKLRISDNIYFMGYRNDIQELISISDIAFSASYREGLPVNIIESMACGITIVASHNRGHNSLIKNNISGKLFFTKNKNQMIEAIHDIYTKPEFADKLRQTAIINSKKYDIKIVQKTMESIYSKYM